MSCFSCWTKAFSASMAFFKVTFAIRNLCSSSRFVSLVAIFGGDEDGAHSFVRSCVGAVREKSHQTLLVAPLGR